MAFGIAGRTLRQDQLTSDKLSLDCVATKVDFKADVHQHRLDAGWRPARGPK